MKTEKKQGFSEYRYFKAQTHNAPKLAFKFDVNYSPAKNVNSSIRFSYAICNEEDNFCRATARKILDERMAEGNVIVGDFRGKDVSLVVTAIDIVDDLIHSYEDDGDFKDILKKDKKALRKFNNIKKLRDSHQLIVSVKNIEKLLDSLEDGEFVDLSEFGC